MNSVFPFARIELPEDLGAGKGLRPQELEAVYAINRAIAMSVDIDSALDQIIRLTRPIFIFDNVALYLLQEGQLNPAYARLIGRGRAGQGELTWDDAVAEETFKHDQSLVFEEKNQGWEQDRIKWRTFLGLPLKTTEETLGVLVFGRFGGPLYTPEHVRLAEFIASHITQLIEHQKLVEQSAQLEAERRLRKMQEDFIANVSHELRTPLGFIKGYATTLLRDEADWDNNTRREFLSYIDEEADRLDQLIDALLDSSRLQAGVMQMKLRPVSLNTMLDLIHTRAQAHYPSISLQIESLSDFTISADPMRLTQVFDNMIDNVVKYAPGSPINIKVEYHEDQVHIMIQDQGPGIAPEHIERLFERFYRVPAIKDRVHGSGLGLYICKQIILEHHGEMCVESQLSKGTTFHMYLPSFEDTQLTIDTQEKS